MKGDVRQPNDRLGGPVPSEDVPGTDTGGPGSANGAPVRRSDPEGDDEELRSARVEAQRAEAALARQREELEIILDSTPAFIFYKDRENRFLWVNRAFAEVMGLPRNQLVGRSVFDLYPRPQADAYWEDDQKVLSSGQPRRNIVEPMQTLTGERWVRTDKIPYRDARGEVVGVIGFAVDITDRKQAEEALRRSERIYRAIGESIDYGIWVCEPDGGNTYASESFLKLVGMTAEQCASYGWGDALHPEDAARTLAAWKECVRTGGTWDIEHRYRGVDGQFHPILARGVPVRDEHGKVFCWAGINLDISRLKRTEEHLRTSLQEKEILLKEIHHRVKNNLQVVSSLISLQADTVDDPALRRSLEDVRHRVRTMALVHDQLYQSGDLARLDFAEYAASLLRYLWRAHGATAARVQLTLALQPVILPMEKAVPCGLILNELATNVLKHAFPGQSSGQVTVALAAEAESGQACLRVSDTGVGLPSGWDWHESRSLGLRLVQMLTQQIEGTVAVTQGPGTEFRIQFPLPQLA